MVYPSTVSVRRGASRAARRTGVTFVWRLSVTSKSTVGKMQKKPRNEQLPTRAQWPPGPVLVTYIPISLTSISPRISPVLSSLTAFRSLSRMISRSKDGLLSQLSSARCNSGGIR